MPIWSFFAVVLAVDALTPTLIGLQIFCAALFVLVLVSAWLMLRKLVLVATLGRLWVAGTWREVDHHAYVTVGSLPWEIVDLPCVVVALGDGRSLDAGLWRFRESAAARAGRRLAEHLGVEFR